MDTSLIIQDSLEVSKKVVDTSTESVDDTNWWFWIAIIQFCIIMFLILKSKLTRKHSVKQKLKKESLSKEVDFDNIINSSFNSKEIYDELKVKCHPDRFSTNEEKNIIAENIFQEMIKNKNNVKRLLELKEEAKQKLSINF